jgi:prepilin-type N-terminal cleavage/methylation domain-containing protein
VTTRAARHGYTLFELLLVLAIIVILAIIVVPSVGAFRGDSRQQAGADMIRSELAYARARAKEEGRPYRVAFSTDHTRIRRAPDDSNFETTNASTEPGGTATAVEYSLGHVTAELVEDPTTNTPAPLANNGWVTLATVQPDGSCLENSALIAIKEHNEQGALYMRMRGLTTSLRTIPSPFKSGSGAANGGGK